MKVLKWFGRNAFLLLLAAVLLLGEAFLRARDPVKELKPVWKDDFEILQLDHPEEVWDKVFYGSSSVIAAYIEGRGDSGYINAGLDYGTIQDLWEMIDGGHARIGSELVLGVDELTFLDDLPTNPTYVWHRAWYEPYVYFHRDRLWKIIDDGVHNLMEGERFITIDHSDQEHQTYHGHLNDQELAAHMARVEEQFGDMSPEGCAENFAALEKLADWCRENGVRLRAVWMPLNSKVELFPAGWDVIHSAQEKFSELGIETLDLIDAVPAQYFYDIGHLDYETGAPYFTDLIEPWLKGENLT